MDVSTNMGADLTTEGDSSEDSWNSIQKSGC